MGITEKATARGQSRQQNYAAHYSARRLQAVESEGGEIDAIVIEWEEVRLAVDCVQTMLKIQNRPNATQQLLGAEKKSAANRAPAEDGKKSWKWRKG